MADRDHPRGGPVLLYRMDLKMNTEWPMLLIIAVVMGSIAIACLLLGGCSSNPRDDPNIVNCGNGNYARTKTECQK